MVARQPDKVSPWLAKAAEHPRTFYGMIARRLLGADSPFRWNEPVLQDDRDIATAFADVRARRAMALLQVAQHHRAETELRQVAKSASTETKLALVAIADQIGLPALALRAASSLDGVSGRRIEQGPLPVATLDSRRRFQGGPRPDLRGHAPGIRFQFSGQKRGGRPGPDAAHARDRGLYGEETFPRPVAQQAL